MKKTKCKTCGGKVNSHNYCNACLTFAQPEAQAGQKVVDALFNQQIDKIKKTIYPISGFASSIPPEQKECWRCNLGEPKEFHVCEPNPSKCEHSHEPSSCKHCRPQPEAQMEQKECLDSDHLNHKDCPTKRQWGLEAARAANKAQAKLVKNYNAQCRRCNLGEPKEFHGCEPYPQPTDGLYQKKPVVGWEDYSVDTLGKVWSTKKGVEKELSPSSINGYQRVYLSQAGKSVSFFVHRLVLETFVGSCPIGQQTCHNNGVRADNRLVNLRWDTPSSNQADRIKHGTFQCGEAASNARLTEKEVKEIWELHLKGVPLIEIVKDYPHVTVYAIQKIVEGINWKHLNPKKDG
jgi:hypothetical protein